MICWVLYDITEDKARTKVAKSCLQAGLYRVQYSVFLGTLTPDQKDELEVRIQDLIDEEEDSVYIFPMNKQELQECSLLGQAFDKKLVTDKVKSLFF